MFWVLSITCYSWIVSAWLTVECTFLIFDFLVIQLLFQFCGETVLSGWTVFLTFIVVIGSGRSLRFAAVIWQSCIAFYPISFSLSASSWRSVLLSWSAVLFCWQALLQSAYSSLSCSLLRFLLQAIFVCLLAFETTPMVFATLNVCFWGEGRGFRV